MMETQKEKWRVLVSVCFVALITGLLLAGSACAQQREEESSSSEAAQAPADPRVQAQVAEVRRNLTALNLQQVTVQVLAGQYQKELSNLQQSQAVFCDTYDLDVSKFRQGGYRFDEKTGKFELVEAIP